MHPYLAGNRSLVRFGIDYESLIMHQIQVQKDESFLIEPIHIQEVTISNGTQRALGSLHIFRFDKMG